MMSLAMVGNLIDTAEIDDVKRHYLAPSLRVSLQVLEATLPLLDTEWGVVISAPGGGLFITQEVNLRAAKIGMNVTYGMPFIYLSINKVEDFTFPERTPKESMNPIYFEDTPENIQEMARMIADCFNHGRITEE